MGRKTIHRLALLGCVAFTCLSFATLATIPGEYNKNKTLTQSFATAANWIDNYIAQNGQLPSNTNFEAWKQTITSDHPYGVKSVNMVNPQDQQSYQEIINTFGQPKTTNSYVLTRPMHKYNEYYASWTQTSTLHHNKRYYWFCIQFSLPFLAGACLCGYIAYRFSRPEKVTTEKKRTKK